MAALLLVAVAQAVLFAEVIAISAALTGEPDPWETWLVASVLVGLTATALGSLAIPWYSHVFDATGRATRYANHAVMAALALVVVILAVVFLARAVQAEQDLQRLTAALSEAREQNTASQLLAAYDRVYQARAEAGLVRRAEARRVRVCLTDRAFLEAFQAALAFVVPESTRFRHGILGACYPANRSSVEVSSACLRTGTSCRRLSVCDWR
jgi:hypothetical protein